MEVQQQQPDFGGLNRDVWLHVMGKVYQTLHSMKICKRPAFTFTEKTMT